MVDTKWLTEVHVECINCHEEVVTDFDSIQERKMLRCSHCNTSFHINDVYDMYCSEEPLVKNCVDLILKYANRPWSITGRKGANVQEIETLLKRLNLESLVERILNDVVKYGDAYLEIVRNSDTRQIIGLKPLEAKTIRVVLEETRAYTGERKVLEFIERTSGKERHMAVTDVIHVKKRIYSTLYAPYGESVLQIALRPVHYLRNSRLGAMRVGARWWIEYLENQICLGVGIPRILLEHDFAKYGKTSVDMSSLFFINRVGEVNRALESCLRAELFARVLNAEDFLDVPELEFRKLDTIAILKEGGFDFTEELKALKQTLDLGIISEDEYKRIAARYLG